MDLLTVILFPTQVAACFIFVHVELLMCHPLPPFLPSLYWPLFIFPARNGINDWLESPLSAATFIPYTTGISSWLVHTSWKLAWHSLSIESKLSMWLAMLTYFPVCALCVYGFLFFVSFPSLPSKLTNTKPKWFYVKRSTWQCRLSDVFFLSTGAEVCCAYGKSPF